ncbi:MAG: hypothetical protein ACR2PX_27690 [Endozoicomonas sp.]|uniref:hypothetical protein n=1 Tax=Endozoicomonas sp. TaxID=1892382 RepID=UPI003D9B42C5
MTPSIGTSFKHVGKMALKGTPDGLCHALNPGARVGAFVGKGLGRMVSVPIKFKKKRNLFRANQSPTAAQVKKLDEYQAKVVKVGKMIGAVVGGIASLPLALLTIPGKGLYNILKGILHARSDSFTRSKDMQMPKFIPAQILREKQIEVKEEFDFENASVVHFTQLNEYSKPVDHYLARRKDTGQEFECRFEESYKGGSQSRLLYTNERGFDMVTEDFQTNDRMKKLKDKLYQMDFITEDENSTDDI